MCAAQNGHVAVGRRRQASARKMTPDTSPRVNSSALRPLLRSLLLVGGALLSLASVGFAQEPADFYRGKTITLVVSTSSGGDYDTRARLLARHMTRHIPGAPKFVVQNMPGAGGLRGANWLYNVAAQDGTALAALQQQIPLSQLFKKSGVEFDMSKLHFIGNTSASPIVVMSWSASPIKSFADVFNKEFIVGGSGAGTSMESYPKLLNNIFGSKIKIISGYKGGADVLIAMERGEVDGRCGASLSTYKTVRPEWLTSGKINVLLQTSLKKDPAAGDTPWIMDLPMTENQRSTLELVLAPRVMHRTFLAPPETQPDRLATLRKAFASAVGDPEFMNEAKATALDIDYSSPEEIDQFVRRLAGLPLQIRHSAAEALKREDRTTTVTK